MSKKNKKIFYEGEWRKITEDSGDHIHIDDGTVIREHEIIKNEKGKYISTYSQKRELINLNKMTEVIKVIT